MKKVFLFALISVLVSGSFAQGCLNDVWQSIQNKRIMEAKKKIDACMVGNEEFAKAWLYKGNVYLSVYNQDIQRLQKNKDYVSKTPNAIWVAYESFYKALELNNKLGAVDGLIDAREGQILCGKPIYDMGIAAKDAKKYADAEKYFRAAIKCFGLENAYKQYVGYLYLDLANVVKEQRGEAEYREILEEAVNSNTDRVQIYIILYQYYQKEKNNEMCANIISKGKKNVSPESKSNIYLMELGYLSAIGDTAKLEKVIADISKKFDTVPATIVEAANYLVEGKQYAKAISILDTSILRKPNDFSLCNMKAYTYFMQATEIIRLRNEAVKERNYDLGNQYKAQQDECIANAHEWAEKAYQIKPKDLNNAMILRQLKLQLGKEVPAELNAIIEELSPESQN